jgi:hypothetical protein
MRRCAAAAVLIPALVLLSGLLSGRAAGERVQRGHLIASVGGGIFPHTLPRHRRAPVGLRIGGHIYTDDGSPLPRLTRIELAIAGRGQLFTRGLAVCPRGRLANADNRQAMTRCGPAVVGKGRIEAIVFTPRQQPFRIASRLLAFNGRTSRGAPAVWVHAFSPNPPVSIVLPFFVHRRPGRFRTALVARVPRSLGPLPHLAGFQISFSRRFRYRGALRSYLSANCPAIRGFTGGFLSFARASYGFADGRDMSVAAVRGCRTR